MKIINFESRLILSFEFFGLGIMYDNTLPQAGIDFVLWRLSIDFIFIRFWIQRNKRN